MSGISNAGLASDPSDAENGDLYYNTTSGVFRQYLNGTWSNVGTGTGSGTVTSVSVVSANGLAGTVATATTTPALTLSTTITGILQGNGTAISAASTTGSGSVVLATSPTLVSPLLGNAQATSLTLADPLGVGDGGTGVTSFTSNAILIGDGSSLISQTAVGVAGQILEGSATAPTWTYSPTLGISNSNAGQLVLATNTNSGLVTVQQIGAASNYNFNIPATAGSSGQVLTSAGGGNSAMTWTTPTTGTVTSVALAVPSFLTISGSPITTSGTLTIGLATITANTVFAGPTSGSAATPTFRNLVYADVSPALKAPTIQTFATSGTTTYTTPSSPTPLYLRVRMVGGGGGGGGSGAGGGSGTAGTATIFGSSFLTAYGGSGGSPQSGSGAGGAGGSSSITSPAIGSNFTGSDGSGAGEALTASTYSGGGSGGTSPFGGAGGGGASGGNGQSAAANTGSGGGGGGSGGGATNNTAGSGGGSGGYIDVLIPSPSSSYSVTIGSGGTGQTAGTGGGGNGGNGALGYVVVTEYYQ
jgi:hypothetical protein